MEWVAPNPVTGVLVRRSHEDRETQRKDDNHVKMEAEMEGCGQQPMDPDPPECGRGRKDSRLEPSDDVQP